MATLATIAPPVDRTEVWTPPAPVRMGGVIVASSVGSLIEWYDFFVFATLAPTLAPKFYPPGDATVELLLYLSTFAVGCLVRPFGALFFGRLGDLVGRKNTFLLTLLIMGASTAGVGLLPGYGTIGYLAPALLIVLRLLQGLAIGGEYGGAAVYVAEHVADRRRGFCTSFIQSSAPAGLLLSILVVLGVQHSMSPATFARSGYRIPFLVSLALVVISLVIRLRMQESPIFRELKAKGATSSTPIRDAWAAPHAKRRMLQILFGLTAGLGVVAYTATIYSLFYMTTILKVETEPARWVMAIALLASLPLFTAFGALSDRIGRKRLMMAGLLLAAVSYLPIYRGMASAARTGVVALRSTSDPVTREPRLSAVDHAGQRVIQKTEKTRTATHRQLLAAGAVEATRTPNYPLLVLLAFIPMALLAMIYGPTAAYLVEAFPAAVRYTSLSLPYHLGAGVVGGLLPTIGLYVNAATKNMYAGLVYPMVFAGLAFVVGSVTLPETHEVDLWAELVGADGIGQVADVPARRPVHPRLHDEDSFATEGRGDRSAGRSDRAAPRIPRPSGGTRDRGGRRRLGR
jgi:MFS family permease